MFGAGERLKSTSIEFSSNFFLGLGGIIKVMGTLVLSGIGALLLISLRNKSKIDFLV
ncbi:MAG: hypothetical protein JWQ35_1481, partial [Bacteriovoracaceae bacterium]|nr:hypothetical protein [Bacteriovoracaceae bacterium]